jgi:hypothetical protein
MKELLCPKCEPDGRPNLEQKIFHEFLAEYCDRCGSKLISMEINKKPRLVDFEGTIPVKNLPLSELTEIIRKAIENEREAEKKEISEREEEVKEILKEEQSYIKNIVSMDGINLQKVVTDTQAQVAVYEDFSPDGVAYILKYVTDLETLPELWDDLSDILILRCHPKIKIKYFKQFSVKDKPYHSHITTIYEGGDLYVK